MLSAAPASKSPELPKREKFNRGYMSRVLRLTLLAPDIVEAILDGRQPEGMRLEGPVGGVFGEMETAAGGEISAGASRQC